MIYIKSMLRALSRGIWPIKCLICHKFCTYNFMLCDLCYDLLPHAEPENNERIAFHYEHPISDMITGLKYHQQTHYAHLLAHLWLRRFDAPPSVDAIIPVPLSAQRYRQRGFNQCQLLAKVIAQQLYLSVCYGVRRIKHTPAQAQLSEQQRRRNLRQAFTAIKAPKKVAILDDVITTGATMNEIENILQRHGCIYIEKWAISKTTKYS